MFQNLQGGFLNNPQAGGGGGSAAAAAGPSGPPPTASARIIETFLTFANAEECCTFLDSLYQKSPSPNILSQLGQVRIGKDLFGRNQQVPVMYLQTAAKHLIVATALIGTPDGSGGGGGSILTTTMTARRGGSSAAAASSPLPVIMETIGIAATYCERSSIANTGILLAMDHLLMTTPNSAFHLSPTLVEFLQVGLLAGQYRFIRSKVLQPTIWPLPSSSSSIGDSSFTTTTTTTAEHVLRYYHLRGMIHLACNEHALAIRSFWTCLSIPMDVVSMIAIDAWKKMVLTQVIVQSNQPPPTTTSSNNNQLRYENLVALPPGASPAVSRLLLTTAKTTAAGTTTTTMAAPTAAAPPPPPPEVALPEAEMSDSPTGGSILVGPPPPPPESPSQQQQYYGIPIYHQLLHAICSSSTTTTTTMSTNNNNTTTMFRQVATQYQSQWQYDSTTGLVEQCSTALQHVALRQMANQYSVVPLVFIAEQMGMTTTRTTNNSLDQVKSLLESVRHLKVEYLQDNNNTTLVQWKVMVEPLLSNKVQSNLKELMTLTTRIRSLDCTFASTHNLPSTTTTTGGGGKDGSSTTGGGGSSKRNPIGVEDF